MAASCESAPRERERRERERKGRRGAERTGEAAYYVQLKQVQVRQWRATRARRGALAALRTQGEAQATVSTRVARATCGALFYENVSRLRLEATHEITRRHPTRKQKTGTERKKKTNNSTATRTQHANERIPTCETESRPSNREINKRQINTSILLSSYTTRSEKNASKNAEARGARRTYLAALNALAGCFSCGSGSCRSLDEELMGSEPDEAVRDELWKRPAGALAFAAHCI